jgi:hypothetical protein
MSNHTITFDILVEADQLYLSTSFTATNLRDWQHIAVTYDGNFARIYLNGNLVASSANQNGKPIIYQTNNPTLIGAESGSGATPEGSYWNGMIATTKIYSRSLSANDITHSFNEDKHRFINTIELDPNNLSNVELGVGAVKTNDAGGSISFNGASTSAVYTKEADIYKGPDLFTLQAWIKTTSTFSGKIIGFETSRTGDTSVSYDRMIYMNNDGKIVFGIFGPTGPTVYTVTSTTTVRDGNWHHISATFGGENETIRLYVNGTSQGTNTVPSTNIVDYFGYWRFGAGNLATWPSTINGNHFVGLIGEAKIYNGRALNATEVLNSYHETRSRFLEIVDLKADVYSGTGNWLDQSANGNNGVISGAQYLGDAFVFDGVNDQIALPNNIIPWTTDSFSMAVSFKAYESGVILGQLGSGYVPAIRVGVDNKLYADIFYSSSARPRVVFDNIVFNEWYKLIITYQKPASAGGNGTLTGYLYRASNDTTVTITNNTAAITDYGGPYQYFLGYGRAIAWDGVDPNKGDHSYFNGEIGRFYATRELFVADDRTTLINDFEQYLSTKASNNSTNTLSAFTFVSTSRVGDNPFGTDPTVRTGNNLSTFGSYLFGDYSYISTRYESSDFILNGDLTIEWYQFKTDATNRWARPFQIIYGNNYSRAFGFSIEDSGLYVWTPDRNYFGAAGDYRTTYNNRWVHFAIVRQSGVLRLYIDGVSIALRSGTSQSTEPPVNQPSIVIIGRIDPKDNSVDADMNGQFEGNISQFRIVKGEAIYTANFTRPAVPLMPVPGTILILSP